MKCFDDIDKDTITAKIKTKFGADTKIFFLDNQHINYIKILKQGKYFVINRKYEAIFSTGYDQILFANEVPDNTFYFEKENMDDICSNQLPMVHIESNKGLIIVKSNNKYGILSTYGHEVLPIKYQKIIWISKDRIIICMEGKYGLSDTKGTCLIPCIYDELRPMPFVKQYSYDYDEEFRQYAEEVRLLVAQSRETDGYVENGFNMNGEMVIRNCLSINLGEYFSLIDTFGEFPYVCAELYKNLILQLFPRRYYFLELKTIGFDYRQHIQEYENCIDYVCGKIVDNEE